MKIVLKGINKVFDTNIKSVNEIIIENQKLLLEILEDFNLQFNGGVGESVISNNDKVLATEKYCEVHSQFVPFKMNTKTLNSKLNSSFEKVAISGEHYNATMEEIGRLEKFLEDIAFELQGDIQFNKINISSLIKAAGISFNENYESLEEKILDYIELVTGYDKEKVFILLNLRTFISDDGMEAFIEEIVKRHYHILLLESSERKLLPNCKRCIVDSDLCVIS